MQTARFDFKHENAVRRGSDFRLDIVLEQPNGAPVDLTGCSVAASFKKTLTATTNYSLSVSILEPLAGSISLLVPHAVTANLSTGKYLWDLIVIFTNGDQWRGLEGELHLVGGITNA